MRKPKSKNEGSLVEGLLDRHGFRSRSGTKVPWVSVVILFTLTFSSSEIPYFFQGDIRYDV